MQATTLIGILLGAIAAGPIAQMDAGSPDEIVARANELVAQGQYAEAITEYERAAELKPDAPEVAYNKGVALYRLGDFNGAAEAFGDAMSASRPWLDRRARYNLGNCAFAEALANKDQDPQAAIEQLNTALGHYRDVLKADARDTAARANLERSQLLKERLEEMLQQQQQQQQNQQSDDEDQGEQEESSDKQKSQQNDEKKDQQQSEQDKQQQGEQQQQDKQQSEDGEQQQSEQDQQKESQQQQSDKQNQAQSQEQQGSEEGEKQEQADKQEPKDGDLKEADEEQNDGDQQQEQQAKPTDNPPKDGKRMPGKPMKMSQEEAKKLLQMIRDKEQLRRAQLLRAQQQKQEPVEKDW